MSDSQDLIHPRGFFRRWLKLFNPTPNIEQMSLKEILVDVPITIIAEVYGGKQFRQYASQKVRGLPITSTVTRPSIIKMLNPLNVPLAIGKALSIIIVLGMGKIDYTLTNSTIGFGPQKFRVSLGGVGKFLRYSVVGTIGSALFLVTNILDLFNKTPTQLSERKALRQKTQVSYEAHSFGESAKLLEESDNKAVVKTQANTQAKFEINFSEKVKSKFKNIIDILCVESRNSNLRSCLDDILSDEEYKKFIDYRKEEQYLADKFSFDMKDKPKPKTNLNNEQIKALSAIFELNELLRSVEKKVLPSISKVRLEKQIAVINADPIKSILQNFDSVPVSEPEIIMPNR